MELFGVRSRLLRYSQRRGAPSSICESIGSAPRSRFGEGNSVRSMLEQKVTKVTKGERWV